MVDLEEELERSFCSLRNVLNPNEIEINGDGGNRDDDDDKYEDDENDITDLSHEMTLYSCHKRMR